MPSNVALLRAEDARPGWRQRVTTTSSECATSFRRYTDGSFSPGDVSSTTVDDGVVVAAPSRRCTSARES